MNKILTLAAFAALVILSCKKDEHTTPNTSKYDCTGVTPTYDAKIKAILDKSCAVSGCHDAKTAAEKIDLTTYALAKSHTAHDHFLKSIEHASGVQPMPKGGAKLADDQIKLIACWIQNGAPEK